ncbi:MAG: VWA domain-containing protein [Bacteroidales bacterium]|nr:VWA domain-containing protein [Bacteroidales bacterium]
MIHFEHIQMLWLLLLVPFFSALYIMLQVRNRRRMAAFADSDMLARLEPQRSHRRPVAKIVLLMLALACFVIALANPRVGTQIVKGQRMGADIAICMDVSNSMMAEDLKPNRLERSKRAVSNLLGQLGADRVSLIVFAGGAYIQMPLTSDYSAAKMFVEQVDCNMVATQGTAIGEAIRKAMESFGYGDRDVEWKKSGNRAILVISDGENFEDDAVEAAKEARSQGVMVCAMGMGSSQGAPIPVYRNGRQAGYKTDRNGQTVTTRLNEPMLNEIARAGDGIYIRAAGSNSGISAMMKQLDRLEKTHYGEAAFSEYESRYYYPLALGLVFLVIEVLFTEKKNKKLNLGKLLRM